MEKGSDDISRALLLSNVLAAVAGRLIVARLLLRQLPAAAAGHTKLPASTLICPRLPVRLAPDKMLFRLLSGSVPGLMGVVLILTDPAGLTPSCVDCLEKDVLPSSLSMRDLCNPAAATARSMTSWRSARFSRICRIENHNGVGKSQFQNRAKWGGMPVDFSLREW
jgi:hypothetical protein